MSKPLSGILVLDFTQFLSGPSATLRLHDLGARVIKVEHHKNGDLSRSIYANAFDIENESAFFQAINRGKESLRANLKDEKDLALITQIIKHADVVVNNFRPGVMTRLGLSFEDVAAVNPTIIYAEITGYGKEGPWANMPGQDLLLQAVSGLSQLSGADSDGHVPMGLAIADYLAGAQLVQGILAALLNDEATQVEVSMLEAILDFQFEPLTLYYQDKQAVVRGENNTAHSLVGAPYGLYKTADGYIALAMGAIVTLGELLDCKPLLAFTDPSTWFSKRDSIKTILAEHLVAQTSAYWLNILEPADIWCADVLNWQDLLAHDGFKVLNMVQTVSNIHNGKQVNYKTLRCPIRIDDKLLKSTLAAPSFGQHSVDIAAEFSSHS
ncbi:CaiB/BaiF CoA transferase family protein [Agaribacter marinus]|uniref:CoA transferase n=1 Tax=Agaribacter marinus TaxID=1431249 RepID=A0AA37WGU3_9ALTE|nr:CoA transferase [Agaribacter marinus]GLR70591.1 CoA transferase [Agaribacter marinus]